MEIKDVVMELSARKAQGQLVVKLVGEQHLCNILFEAGRAVYMTLGRCEVAEILERIKEKKIESTRFIDNFPVRKTLDIPLHEQLLGDQNPPANPVATVAAPQVESAPAAVAPAAGALVGEEQIEQLKQDFLKLMGPEGTMNFMMAAAASNYQQGQPLAREKYLKLVESLAQDLAEEQQEVFVQEHRA